MTSLLLLQKPSYPVIVGRYALFDPIASGGMASVHIGRLLGSFGFARTVAIKRLHQGLALDPEFLAMFLDEARLAARVHHPNVVQTLDVVALENELLLVMEYVSGAALSKILSKQREMRGLTPHRVAVDVMVAVLNGLHAAHEAKNENGEPLHVVHRDVSPQNILLGKDGIARLLDFGIAKAAGAAHSTRPNQIKGKLRYLSPESVSAQSVTRASDIYAASVVLWEMLAGQRLFDAEKEGDILHQVLTATVPPPSHARRHISRKLDEIVMCGLSRDPRGRHATARDMAVALEAAVTPVSRSDVSQWVMFNAGDEIEERDRRVAHIEREVQGEGVAAGLRLQSGHALSSENPHDGRTGSRRSETGSAPSISFDHTRSVATPVPSRHRGLPLSLVGAAAGAALLVGGVWLNARSSDHAAQAATASGLPALSSAVVLRPEPRPPAPVALPNAPALAVSAAQSPPIVPVVNQSGARRVVSGAVRKSVAPDRIYRRD